MEVQPEKDNGARIRQLFREAKDRAMDMNKPREIERLAGLIQANSPHIPASLDGALYHLGRLSRELVAEHAAGTTDAREVAKQIHLSIDPGGCAFSRGADKCLTCEGMTERILGLLSNARNVRAMAFASNQPTSWRVTLDTFLDEEREACAKLLDAARSEEIAMAGDCRKRGSSELETAHRERASVLEDVAAAIRAKTEESQRMRRMAEKLWEEREKRDKEQLDERRAARRAGGGLDQYGVRRDDYIKANLLARETVTHFTGQGVRFEERKSENHPLIDHHDWLVSKLHELLREASKI